jgi:hypothetical protein
VAQLHTLFIRPNVSGISLGYMAMNVINQLIWVTWAAFAGESSVILVGSTLGLLMAVNLCGRCSDGYAWSAPDWPTCMPSFPSSAFSRDRAPSGPAATDRLASILAS